MQKRSYGQFMSDTFSSPLVERFQSRSTRRAVVIAMQVWAITEIALIVFAPQAWWAWAPLLLVFFPLASMINMSVRGVTEIPLSHLDDRLAQLRMKAFHDAYHVGVLLALLAGAWLLSLFMGIQSDETDPQTYILAPAGALIFGGLVGLPATLLAWRLPDEPADEA